MPNFVRITRPQETLYIPHANIAAVSEAEDGSYVVFVRDQVRNTSNLKIDANKAADIELLRAFVTADVRA